jgi:hypothetical protein
MSTNFYRIVGSLVGTSCRTGPERIEAIEATQQGLYPFSSLLHAMQEFRFFGLPLP